MAEPTAPLSPRAGVHSGLLYCDVCGEETLHRILSVDAARGGGASGRMSGVARCGVCRVVHRFTSAPPAAVEVAQVLSEGGRSVASRISIPAGRRLQVGSDLPEARPPLRIHKIERRDHASVPEARAEEIATVWVTPDRGAVVAVSIIEGRRTRTVRLPLPPETPIEVGDEIDVEGRPLRVVGLRALGRTWRRPGDRFRALEVQRVYARRTERPPAGRSDWRTVRESPRSRESSTSRAARSLSSPGVSRNLRRAGSRNEAGGATVHRSSP